MIPHLIAILLSVAPNALPYRYTGLYDGDTTYFAIELDGYQIPLEIRIQNIDTPEIRGKCPSEKQLAQDAKRVAAVMLANARDIRFAAVQPKLDQYGRILANVVVDGADLGDRLVELQLARPWDGARRSWC